MDISVRFPQGQDAISMNPILMNPTDNKRSSGHITNDSKELRKKLIQTSYSFPPLRR